MTHSGHVDLTSFEKMKSVLVSSNDEGEECNQNTKDSAFQHAHMHFFNVFFCMCDDGDDGGGGGGGGGLQRV